MPNEYRIEHISSFINGEVSTTLQLDSASRMNAQGEDFFCSKDLNSSITRMLIEKLHDGGNALQEINRLFITKNKKADDLGLFFSACLIDKFLLREFDSRCSNESEEHVFRIIARNKQGSTWLRDLPFSTNIVKNLDMVSTIIEEIATNTIFQKNCHVVQPNAKDYPLVILSPQASAYLFHEIVGHLLEYDFLYSGRSFFKISDIGKRLFPKYVNIIDDPFVMSKYGVSFGKYDDSGKELKKTTVISEGKLISGIGTKRVDTILNQPLYRMYNLYLAASPNGPELKSMIKSVASGIYVGTSASGNVNPYNGRFSLRCNNCQIIRNGHLMESINDFSINSSIEKAMESIEAIGSDLEFFPSQCSKQGQLITVGTGGVSILINSYGLL